MMAKIGPLWGGTPFSAKKKSVENWPKNSVFWMKNAVFGKFLASCRPLRGEGGTPEAQKPKTFPIAAFYTQKSSGQSA